MIRRQIHVGRMQYAPTLPTEKAIPNDWFRVKVLRTTECLSVALDENSPPFHRPIYYTRRKPAELQNTYPPLSTKALGDSVDLSAASNESSPNHRRPIRCIG